MRIFRIVADVVMGLLVGLFLYVALSRSFSTFDHPIVGLIVAAASVALVLFRRPNGSLSRRRQGRPESRSGS